MSNSTGEACRTVAITGASRGIGFGIARHFAKAGANVVVGGLHAAETDAAVAELRTLADRGIVGVAGDIADPSVAEALIDTAFAHFGQLDTVVCNAGVDIIKPALDYTTSEWDHILAVNLRGGFLPAQTAARRWIERNQAGCIIFTSSIAGRCGIAGLAPYSASKSATDQLVRALAVEWGAHRIRVNAVAPGYVDNIMAGVTIHGSAEGEKRILDATPLGRRASIDEIAAPYVFLASQAAGYITGATLMVDGGYSAG